MNVQTATPSGILFFDNITLQDLPEVGGKNASLGEMLAALKPLGVQVPDGFAVKASAFRRFLAENDIAAKLQESLSRLDTKTFSNLAETGSRCRELVRSAKISDGLRGEIMSAFATLRGHDEQLLVAVRSSATAEDLPTASFAGQHDSFLNVNAEGLIEACRNCYASLYNDRAIKYRVQKGFDHAAVALSIGIQRMVRSDAGSAGVAFTIEPETGFRNMIYVTGVWGLGENIVQGAVTPDEFYLFKPALRQGLNPLVTAVKGEKARMLVFQPAGADTVNVDTPPQKRAQFVLERNELETLGRWCLAIEEHYRMPMDIEWAKDGVDGQLYIVQARPETLHGTAEKKAVITEFTLKEKARLLAKGKAVGGRIHSGRARILSDPSEGHKLGEGEILVTNATSPDWNAVLRKAAVIVTNHGGRTSHASIVARELGLSAVVGTGNATEVIADGDEITVSCAEGDEGKIYAGRLKWEERTVQLDILQETATRAMLIMADPSRALTLSFYPSSGVGLLRMEFIINNHVRVHPMALVRFDELADEKAKAEISALTAGYRTKAEFFVDRLSQGVAMVAAAFHPREVIVRMSDFKTNEYAGLLGGAQFEPHEENPMLGFRGASRYYHPRYRDGFRLECEAMKRIRNDMGLTNVKLMIPFCRTPEEGGKVLREMASMGLARGQNDLEVYVMAEIPSNVILAAEFAALFDGFSIGSNDLTQLTLGVDRDSEIISDLFEEDTPAPRWMISHLLERAKQHGTKVGLCGQAPSDKPEFARFLVREGIDSVSFNPDALLRGIDNIRQAEEEISQTEKQIVS